MDWWQQALQWVPLLLGGGLFVGAAALLTVWATRRRDKDTDLQTRFAANMELNTYLDTKIETATAPLKKEIAELRAQLVTFKSRDEAVKSILRSLFQRLMFWDQNGRPGPMPMPSQEDIETLDLDLDLATPKIEDWRLS